MLSLLKRKEPLLKALVTKLNRSSYVQITIITVKIQSAGDIQSHCLHVKMLDFAPFMVCIFCEGIRVITLAER